MALTLVLTLVLAAQAAIAAPAAQPIVRAWRFARALLAIALTAAAVSL